jgi:hypothetical protein
MTVHDPLGPQPDEVPPQPTPGGGQPEPVTPILPDPSHDPDPGDPPQRETEPA